ncbi:hypothetical protein CVS54_01288 [Microbacterium oxydans]|uniref:Serine recombinase n=1 Tax=Microbacterium oxydans TaxID=82380 RepID=A0A3S9WIS9_9MICO|nr:recombinase family protein [Microbacterium oxydans]AZS39970.1 hypothetical protein CVS54_01288 [Microbacterium oxydans]
MEQRAVVPSAIYARISHDKTGGGLGVDRQEADCRSLAERMGWDVVAVFVDNDISAYSGAPRPQYRALLDAVRRGEVRGIIAWHTDRLHRRASELEEFVNLAEAHHLQIQTVTAGTVDLSTASGRMVARMLGAAAQHEVEHAKERMKRAKDQMAADGKYRGGQRPFGFEKDGMTVRESEAKVIREATKAILAGRTLAGVAREINASGSRTAPGREWTYGRLKEMLVRPRNAGLLAHGLPGRNANKERRGRSYDLEIVGQAAWPAIVPEDEWRALMTMLTDPSRIRQHGNETRWLGSGIYRCGLCGSSMRPAPYGGTNSNKGRTRKFLYRCTGQAHLTISTDPTDAYVRGAVAEMIRDPRVMAAMRPGEDSVIAADREERAKLSRRLDAFERDYAAGDITAKQLRAATERVSAEIEAVDARMAKALRSSASSTILRADDPGQAFMDAPIDVQRSVLATVLGVTIVPAAKKGAPWTEARVRLSAGVAE